MNGGNKRPSIKTDAILLLCYYIAAMLTILCIKSL